MKDRYEDRSEDADKNLSVDTDKAKFRERLNLG